MDWNGDGKVDGEDWIMTEMLLDDEGGGGGSSNKPDGSCLGSIVLFIGIPIAVLFIGHIV